MLDTGTCHVGATFALYILREACFTWYLTHASRWISMYSSQQFLFTPHTASAMANVCWWHEGTSFPQAAVYHSKQMYTGLPLIWISILYSEMSMS
jgi:hypothetical protein